jgi:hypothetical protein
LIVFSALGNEQQLVQRLSAHDLFGRGTMYGHGDCGFGPGNGYGYDVTTNEGGGGQPYSKEDDILFWVLLVIPCGAIALCVAGFVLYLVGLIAWMVMLEHHVGFVEHLSAAYNGHGVTPAEWFSLGFAGFLAVVIIAIIAMVAVWRN